MYREYKSHPLLSPYIETYWVIEGFAEKYIPHLVLPDGCVDLLFILNRERDQMEPSIIGTMTTSLDVSYQGRFRTLGIRFHPGGITAFTRTPVYELTNRIIDAREMETLFDSYFFEEINNRSSEEFFLYVDSYLLDKLSSVYIPDKRILHAISLIQNSRGNTTIEELADKACMGKRQLERHFLSATGLSPKMFSRIIRFRHTCNYLQTAPCQSLFETAIDCGYYDHAHLIKDFKSLSGYSPSEI